MAVTNKWRPQVGLTHLTNWDDLFISPTTLLLPPHLDVITKLKYSFVL